MKAIVFHDVGDIRLDDVPEPKLEQATDAILRINTSAICGTDLHMVRGTMPGMVPGTVLGHEAVGVVEEVGKNVRNLKRGDRVVVPSTIGCGSCSYCRSGYFAQCDTANPNGPRAGTSFFGGPKDTGPFNGLQSEFARVPYANVGLIKLPDDVSDNEAVLLSDIFPTGYFGADLAEVGAGDTVAVFGCGPVGQFAILSAFLLGAGRVIAVDSLPDRLNKAAELGAETVNFARENPVEAVLELTGGIGVDRAIDAVGIDAVDREGDAGNENRPWQPGNAPVQALDWAVGSLAKAGTLGIIGVYPPTFREFAIGQAMNRNLSINMGNCNHRKYIPRLLELVRSGTVTPQMLLTQHEPFVSALQAYKQFDIRTNGWLKVALVA